MNNGLPVSAHRAASRARWLAEVAAALAGARQVASELRGLAGISDAADTDCEEATLLAEIEALRREVESIRRGGRHASLGFSSETDLLTG